MHELLALQPFTVESENLLVPAPGRALPRCIHRLVPVCLLLLVVKVPEMTIPGAFSAEAHPIAAIRYAAGIAVDDLMQDIIEQLATEGVHLGGLIQQAHTDGGDCCAAVQLCDLHDGTRITISQDLGSNSKGCRLDPAALAGVAIRIEDSLEDDVDILVLNRFGKAEADGQGLRSAIQKAVASGIPVLMAVKDEHVEAWARFHGGLGVALPADFFAILDWCRRVTRFND